MIQYRRVKLRAAIALALIPPLLFAQPLTSGVSRSGAAGDRLPLCPGHFYTCFYRQLTTLAFDKTGTMTQGQPAVQKVYNLS
jgi:hypothetical protein